MKKLLSLISIAGLTISGATATSTLVSCSKSVSDNSGNKDDGDRTVDFELREGYVVDFWLEKDASKAYDGDTQEGIHAFLTVGSDNKIDSSNDKLKDDLKDVKIADKTQLTAAKLQILDSLKTTVNELETDLTVRIDSIIKVKDLGVLNSENFENKASEDDIINAINEKNNLNIKDGDFNIEFPELADNDTCKANISVDKPNTAKVTEFNVKVFSGSATVNYSVKSLNISNIQFSSKSEVGPYNPISDNFSVEQAKVNYFKLSVDGININFLDSSNAQVEITMNDGKDKPTPGLDDDNPSIFSFILSNETHTDKTFNIKILLKDYKEFNLKGLCKHKQI